MLPKASSATELRDGALLYSCSCRLIDVCGMWQFFRLCMQVQVEEPLRSLSCLLPVFIDGYKLMSIIESTYESIMDLDANTSV